MITTARHLGFSWASPVYRAACVECGTWRWVGAGRVSYCLGCETVTSTTGFPFPEAVERDAAWVT